MSFVNRRHPNLGFRYELESSWELELGPLENSCGNFLTNCSALSEVLKHWAIYQFTQGLKLTTRNEDSRDEIATVRPLDSLTLTQEE